MSLEDYTNYQGIIASGLCDAILQRRGPITKVMARRLQED